MDSEKGLKRRIKSVYIPLCQLDHLLAQPKMTCKESPRGKGCERKEYVNELCLQVSSK